MTFAPQGNGGLRREDGRRTTMRAICRSCTIFFSNVWNTCCRIRSPSSHHTIRVLKTPSSDLVKEFSPNQNSEKAKSPLPADRNTVLSTGAPSTWSIPIHNKSALCTMLKNSGYLDQK